MIRSFRIALAATTALTLWLGSQGALAQKSGGILKMPDFASPASMSIHEEVTRAAVTVLMPVFNNLVLFDQHKERNTIDTMAVGRAQRREAAGASVGDRASTGARRLAPDQSLYARRDLLAAARQGSQPCRQQRLQQLALRGHVARQVEGAFAPGVI